MKIITVLILLLSLASCTPSELKEEPNTMRRGAGNDTVAQALISVYESNKLAAAESLDDEAVFKINPCRQSINDLVMTGSNFGTFSVDGVSFSFNNSSGVVMNGDCKINFNPTYNGFIKHVNLVNTSNLAVNGDHTAVVMVTNSSLTHNNRDYRQSYLVVQSETAVTAEVDVPEQNDLLTQYSRSFYQSMGNFYDSSTVAGFQINPSNNTVGGWLVNSKVGGNSISSVVNPAANGTHSADVVGQDSMDFTINLTGEETQGLSYYAVFPRNLTITEQSTISCYAIYLSAKAGNTDMFVANAEECVNN